MCGEEIFQAMPICNLNQPKRLVAYDDNWMFLGQNELKALLNGFLKPQAFALAIVAVHSNHRSHYSLGL